MKIVFTGGGSGGHMFPLVAVIRELRMLHPEKNLEIFYVGPKDEVNLAYLAQEDVIIRHIIAGKVRRYVSLQNVVDICIKIPFGFAQSLFLLAFISSLLVVSKGGTGSVAVTSAARLLGIPVFVHESDAVPGRSNQVASRWANKVFASFPKTQYFDQKKAVVIGNPIRHEVLTGNKQEAGRLFGLSYSKPVLLFTGGSQGAVAMNDFVLSMLDQLLRDYEIIHLTGSQNFTDVEKEAQVAADASLQKYYHPIAFLNEEKMKHAYAAADLVIARAGSGNIFEISALGKPSILVPLPGAGDHQSSNAYQYAQSGAALVVEQDNLTPHFFADQVRLLLGNPSRLNAMKEAALGFAKPLAAKALAREILEFISA